MDQRKDERLLRSSLVLVWLLTGLISLIELNGQSAAPLREAGLVHPETIHALIIGGALLDITLGLVLWLRPSRRAYGAAFAAMLGMTVTATWLLPRLWLDPLGPLLKNLPIAAIVLMLWRRSA